MQTKKKSLVVAGLCLISLLAGYAIAEYILDINNTCQIVLNANLEVTWADTGQPATSYAWGIMNDIEKSAPTTKIKNVGNSQLNVFWYSPDLPANFQLRAYKPLAWETGLINSVILPQSGSFNATFKLKDMGASIGSYSFIIRIESQG